MIVVTFGQALAGLVVIFGTGFICGALVYRKYIAKRP